MPFIVLEGLDGTGKSTQIELLKAYFEKNKKKVSFIHFPRTDDASPLFGNYIAKFLRGEYGNIEQVHPELVALLYAGDRFNASDFIKSELKKGKIVIADRYVFSNIAFQCAKLKTTSEKLKLINHIFEMEYSFFKIPKPDISLFLHVPLSFVEEQLTKNRSNRNYLKGKKDIHEASINFQKNVCKMYLYLCKKFPSEISLIKCYNKDNTIKTPQEINSLILQSINNYI